MLLLLLILCITIIFPPPPTTAAAIDNNNNLHMSQKIHLRMEQAHHTKTETCYYNYLPPGSYQGTCHGCCVYDGRGTGLQCTCTNDAGQDVLSRLPDGTCTGSYDIVNNNGVLGCVAT
jgi:hypothetical protein